jgi:hypothetical protein
MNLQNFRYESENIALRRQVMQLQHFTEGNVPPGLLNAPDGWSAEQFRQFQEWLDSVLAGKHIAPRRHRPPARRP